MEIMGRINDNFFCYFYRVQEYEYLNFISGVTRDILSRGVLSDLALALLFKSHIERNKHRLREVSSTLSQCCLASSGLPCPEFISQLWRKIGSFFIFHCREGVTYS